MARVKLQKIEPVIIEFLDGTEKMALFTNEASVNYVSEFGPFPTEKEIEKDPYGFMAKFLYCALIIRHPETTLEEAQLIMLGGGDRLMTEMTDAMITNFIGNSNEETKKKFEKEIQKILGPYLKMLEEKPRM